MTLIIEHPDADKLAHELIGYTGETVPQAVMKALHERIAREKDNQRRSSSLKNILLKIGCECSALPILDHRTPEEILGYDTNGVPS